MGWRENMGILDSIPQGQNPQKRQKPQEGTPFVPSVLFVPKNQKLKNTSPPPDLSKIDLAYHREYTDLWYRAWRLADYVDGGETVAPYKDRIAKMPELNEMVERMSILERMAKQEEPIS